MKGGGRGGRGDTRSSGWNGEMHLHTHKLGGAIRIIQRVRGAECIRNRVQSRFSHMPAFRSPRATPLTAFSGGGGDAFRAVPLFCGSAGGPFGRFALLSRSVSPVDLRRLGPHRCGACSACPVPMLCPERTPRPTPLGRYLAPWGRYLAPLGRYLAPWGRYLAPWGRYLAPLGRYLTLQPSSGMGHLHRVCNVEADGEA